MNIFNKIERMTDVVFSGKWQAKFYSKLSGIMCAMCFIAAFWNFTYFLLGGMFLVITMAHGEK